MSTMYIAPVASSVLRLWTFTDADFIVVDSSILSKTDYRVITRKSSFVCSFFSLSFLLFLMKIIFDRRGNWQSLEVRTRAQP